MSFSERGIPLGELQIDSVKGLLKTSQEAMALYDIPILGARWDRETSTLVLDMTTPLSQQGLLGICNGGFASAVTDIIGGFAGFLKATESGQIALSSHLEIDFLRPLPVEIPVRVTAKVEEIQGDVITSSVKIVRKTDEKEATRGLVLVKVKVDSAARLNGK